MPAQIMRAWFVNRQTSFIDVVDNVVFHEQAEREVSGKMTKGMLLTRLDQTQEFYPSGQFHLLCFQHIDTISENL